MLLVGACRSSTITREIIHTRRIVVKDLILGARNNISQFVVIPEVSISEYLMILGYRSQGDLKALGTELINGVVVAIGHLTGFAIACLGKAKEHCPSCCDMLKFT